MTLLTRLREALTPIPANAVCRHCGQPFDAHVVEAGGMGAQLLLCGTPEATEFAWDTAKTVTARDSR